VQHYITIEINIDVVLWLKKLLINSFTEQNLCIGGFSWDELGLILILSRPYW